jgi:hypothetical protein
MAQQYDRYRPTYPDALFDDLAALEPMQVLDVGCGTGKAAVSLARRGLSVLGVDVDERMADVARRHGIAVEVAAFESWDDAGRQFDLLVTRREAEAVYLQTENVSSHANAGTARGQRWRRSASAQNQRTARNNDGQTMLAQRPAPDTDWSEVHAIQHLLSEKDDRWWLDVRVECLSRVDESPCAVFASVEAHCYVQRQRIGRGQCRRSTRLPQGAVERAR